MNSLFSYDRNCSVTIDPMEDCVVHPTMMCNGIQNCPDCSDEIYENCMQAHCKSGGCFYNYNLIIIECNLLKKPAYNFESF